MGTTTAATWAAAASLTLLGLIARKTAMASLAHLVMRVAALLQAGGVCAAWTSFFAAFGSPSGFRV